MLTLKRSQASLDAPLRAAQAIARQRVVEVTDTVRGKFLTRAIGQELTYGEKEAQAQAFLAASPEPQEPGTEYGFVFGEVGITADTPRAVAEAVLAKAFAYRAHIGPMIERLRLLAGKQINEAATVSDVEQSVAEFIEDMGEI
ncbi:hypothetical protein ETW23_03930 [Leisingera sp. NJS201]|uniref:hypothetical protein n=1 Tax=Leisingera sp. NJS201 TaxID=2508306 RepID=UPI001070B4EE|nr:hypothetical protein [Leisingera sp. NJS201]QBR35415.1 hypothetical protein ETW23_03930 [Leisingera sp. NJS201]